MKVIAVSAAAVAAFAALGVFPAESQGTRAPPAKGRTCFMADDISGWAEGGPGKVNLRTRRGDHYEAVLLTACPELDFTQRMGVISRSDRICVGDDATLITRSSGVAGADRCRIDRIRLMTPQEVAALPKNQQP
jgi:hypothetical protein